MTINNSLPLTLPLNARPDIVAQFTFTTANKTVGTAAADNFALLLLPELPTGVEWVLTAANMVCSSNLATNNSNYVSLLLKNLSNSSADMFSTADSNTTKTTGGSALTANTKRTVVLSSSEAAKTATGGAVLQFSTKGTGTLANAVNNVTYTLTFTQYMNK